MEQQCATAREGMNQAERSRSLFDDSRTDGRHLLHNNTSFKDSRKEELTVNPQNIKLRVFGF
jgi:hypothetical protein